MTPKEKAQEIFDKYFEEMLSFGFYLNNTQINKLALIAVDEILAEFHMHDYSDYMEHRFQYFRQVKQEIEKL